MGPGYALTFNAARAVRLSIRQSPSVDGHLAISMRLAWGRRPTWACALVPRSPGAHLAGKSWTMAVQKRKGRR